MWQYPRNCPLNRITELVTQALERLSLSSAKPVTTCIEDASTIFEVAETKLPEHVLLVKHFDSFQIVRSGFTVLRAQHFPIETAPSRHCVAVSKWLQNSLERSSFIDPE